MNVKDQEESLILNQIQVDMIVLEKAIHHLTIATDALDVVEKQEVEIYLERLVECQRQLTQLGQTLLAKVV